MKLNLKDLTGYIPCRCGKGNIKIVQVLDIEERGVVHTIPYCKEFQEKDPVDFLHWHNAIQFN